MDVAVMTAQAHAKAVEVLSLLEEFKTLTGDGKDPGMRGFDYYDDGAKDEYVRDGWIFWHDWRSSKKKDCWIAYSNDQKGFHTRVEITVWRPSAGKRPSPELVIAIRPQAEDEDDGPRTK